MNPNLDDMKFLANIVIGGSKPAVYAHEGMVQWNIAGMNFNDRCFQAILCPPKDQTREVAIQVLRRSSSGGRTGEYAWIPLGRIPFTRSPDTYSKILRTIKRWGGLNEDTLPTFRVWLEDKSNE